MAQFRLGGNFFLDIFHDLLWIFFFLESFAFELNYFASVAETLAVRTTNDDRPDLWITKGSVFYILHTYMQSKRYVEYIYQYWWNAYTTSIANVKVWWQITSTGIKGQKSRTLKIDNREIYSQVLDIVLGHSHLPAVSMEFALLFVLNCLFRQYELFGCTTAIGHCICDPSMCWKPGEQLITGSFWKNTIGFHSRTMSANSDGVQPRTCRRQSGLLCTCGFTRQPSVTSAHVHLRLSFPVVSSEVYRIKPRNNIRSLVCVGAVGSVALVSRQNILTAIPS